MHTGMAVKIILLARNREDASDCKCNRDANRKTKASADNQIFEPSLGRSLPARSMIHTHCSTPGPITEAADSSVNTR
jgi:hypothetical protein